MREIKFRGMELKVGEHELSQKWVYGSLVISKDNVRILGEWKKGKGYEVHQVDSESVGEFIGRNDKLGKKLYTKDIVKKVDSFPGNNGDEEIVSIGVISWQKDWPMFSVNLIEGEDESFHHSEGINFYWEELEKIGNTTENPKLMEIPQ